MDLQSAEVDAALAAGCATALACSHFVARALHAEAGGRSQGAASGTPLQRLHALGSSPWSRARIVRDLELGVEQRAGADPAAALAAALRCTRRRLLLGLIARDAAGLAPLAEVTGAMTAFAEIAVEHALRVHAPELAAQHGVPADAQGRPQDLLVVAMGKGGAGELNVSSDLDLVLVYAEEGATRASAVDGAAQPQRPLTNQEFFERLGRRLIATLSEATADGFVFRVDLRLRPNGDSGPLVVSHSMLEEYLVRQGREWERFAWLKGRVVSAPVLADPAGFAEQASALAALVHPFVFRRYLDFRAIAALRDLHLRIRAETGRRVARHPQRAFDVKLGRGGIREIEFIAQTFQIMRGGREPRLQRRGTLETLAALGELDLLPAATAGRLADSYDFLRRLEHALQYVDDAQTHLIPATPDARAAVARLLRLPDAQAMLERQHAVREFVATCFDAIFRKPPSPSTPERGADGPSGAAFDLDALRRLGFERPEEVQAQLAALAGSPRLAVAPESTRVAVERLTARALPAIAARGQAGAIGGSAADEVLLRWIRLLEVIAGRGTYIALLDEYPVALERVLRVLGAGAWATDYLLRHPIVLDELIDDREGGPPEEAAEVVWRDWARLLAVQLEGGRQGDADGDDGDRDLELRMNLLRDAHHAQVFRLLVADLNGQLGLERLADLLSALADAVLNLALQSCWYAMLRVRAQPESQHRGPQDAQDGGRQDSPRFAVIAYGKLGGKELGYASDLDLIFVYAAADDGRSGQGSQHEAATRYATLARRVVRFLTTATSSGILFDIDLRLRPNGNAGLLVTTIEAFEQYQRNDDGHGAWVWEHQALTRARWCAGDAELGERFERLRRDVLARRRERAGLADEVVAMRRRMLDGHPNRGALFDLKHDRGGMVDIEFVVQLLVLAEAWRHPPLLANLGNIRLLGVAAECGLIDASLAHAAAAAYRQYRRLQHALRLNGAAQARVPHAQVQPHIDVVLRLWQTVLGTKQPLPAAGAARAG